MISKKRILKATRTVLVSVLVMVVLAVGAGAAYTWYVGQNSTPISTVVEEQTDARAEIKHVQPAENTPVSASVQSVTTPVTPGENASITVRTKPSAECVISVVYDKTASKDSGLTNKIADDFGMVTWAWTVEPSVPLGKWPVQVTCALNKKSAMVQADLVVAKP